MTSDRLMKGLIASLLFVALASCAATNDPHGLSDGWPSMENDPVQVVALVVDLDSGETLLSRQAHKLVRPASTMKLLTTAAVCRRAPDANLQTTLMVDAMPGGEATLRGGGDPFLSTRDVRNLVAQLRKRGLQTVRGGRVHVEDPLAGADRFGEGWMWDDEPESYMPTISGVAVNGGCVTVVIAGDSVNPEISLQPVAGDLEVRVQPTTGPVKISRGRYQSPHTVTVAGNLDAANESDREKILSVPDLARYTAWVLADAFEQADLLRVPAVVSTGPVTSKTVEESLRVTMQRSLADVIRHTNKVSDNLGAELLLRHLAGLGGSGRGPMGPASLALGIQLVARDLEALGLDATGYRIADGSGVSHYTLISAEVLVKTLVAMHKLGGRSFEVFEHSLPIAGVDGTLRSRMKATSAEGRVRAKTGTISGVSNLAGYVTTRSGRRLAFAILVQNFVGSSRRWRDLQDEFCVHLAGL